MLREADGAGNPGKCRGTTGFTRVLGEARGEGSDIRDQITASQQLETGNKKLKFVAKKSDMSTRYK